MQDNEQLRNQQDYDDYMSGFEDYNDDEVETYKVNDMYHYPKYMDY